MWLLIRRAVIGSAPSHLTTPARRFGSPRLVGLRVIWSNAGLAGLSRASVWTTEKLLGLSRWRAGKKGGIRSTTDRVNRVLNYIEEHLGEDLSLTRLARVGAFSRLHFHRIFQGVTWRCAPRRGCESPTWRTTPASRGRPSFRALSRITSVGRRVRGTGGARSKRDALELIGEVVKHVGTTSVVAFAPHAVNLRQRTVWVSQ